MKKKSSKSKPSKNSNESVFLEHHDNINLFQLLVEQIGDEVLVVKSNGHIVFVNDAAVKGLGFSRKNIINKPITEFIHEKMSVKKWKQIRFNMLKRLKKPYSFITKRIIKDGGVSIIDVTAVYMKYQNEDFILTVARDITDRVNLEQRLQDSETRFRLISEQAVECIFLLDFKGRINYANHAGLELLGLNNENYQDRYFKEFIAKDSLQKATECFDKVKLGGSVIRDEINLTGKDNKGLITEFTGSVIKKDGQTTEICVMIRDISRKKQLELFIKESEKMRALQHFITGTTQEIRAPLRGVLERTKRLLDLYQKRDFEYIGYKEYKRIFKSIENMQSQVQYCFDTIQRLLELNRKKVGLTVDHCPVNTVVRSSMKMVEHALEVSDIALKCKLARNLPMVSIATIELTQIIVNILNNAIQAISSRGEITFRTRFNKVDNVIEIDCTDDGVGISKENLPRLFEPFFTTKERGLERNSGLGLTIAYSLVKTVNGDIKIKSSFRNGTSIKILLPVYSPKKLTKG